MRPAVRSGRPTSGPRGMGRGRDPAHSVRHRCLPALVMARAERGRAPHDHRPGRSGPGDPGARGTRRSRRRPAADPHRTERRPPRRRPRPGRRGGPARPLRRAGEEELRELATEAAAGLISEDPAYSRLAARLLTLGHPGRGRLARASRPSPPPWPPATGRASSPTGPPRSSAVTPHGWTRSSTAPRADDRFGYFGLRTLHSRYLLRHPHHPQGDRDAPALPAARRRGPRREADRRSGRCRRGSRRALRLMSRLEYLPSSPTLFNSGTRHPQMSSCFLLDSPQDELDSIYYRYHQVARLSKHAGGIGLAYSRIRCPRRADPRHQRALQRDRAVPEDARRLGRRREPGRPAQGRGRASTWRPGTRTSRSSWNCATTPARTPAAPTTSTSRTGSRTSSCAGSRPTRSGRCSRPPTSRSWSTCGARSSTPPTGPRRPRGSRCARCRPVSCTAG